MEASFFCAREGFYNHLRSESFFPTLTLLIYISYLYDLIFVYEESSKQMNSMMIEAITREHIEMNNGKKQRKRSVFDFEQLRQLENVFEQITHYPDLALRQHLSGQTQLPDKKIQVHFVVFTSLLSR